MTGTILSLDTWRALGCEYLDDTWHAQRPAFVDHGASIGWGHLLDHVYANVGSFIKPQGERGGYVVTFIPDGTGDARRVDWEPRTDADEIIGWDFDNLKLWADGFPSGESDLPIPLSDLHHDHPYFSRTDNLVFRAWHDTAHLEHNLGFDHDSELKLYGLQAKSISSTWARNALFCESVYQLAASVVIGGYPDHQYCRRIGPVGRAVRDLLIGLA